MSKMELTIKRTVYDYIEKNAEKFLIKEQNQWYIVEWIIFASSVLPTIYCLVVYEHMEFLIFITLAINLSIRIYIKKNPPPLPIPSK